MVLVVLACAAPQLVPSMDLRNDALLAELPASATVIGGGDLAALWSSPTAELLVREDILRRDGLSGFPMEDLGETRLGCGDGGCLVVAEGNFARLNPAVLAPLVPGLRLDAEVSHLRLTPARGKPMDVEYVGNLVRGGDLEVGSGFDASTLMDEVPEGDAWMLIRDPLRMRAQAVARLQEEETEESDEAAAMLSRLPERALSSVLSAAWALDSNSQVLVGRLVAEDANTAQGFEGLARLQLAALSLAPDPRLASMASNAEIRRVDNVLEIEVRP